MVPAWIKTLVKILVLPPAGPLLIVLMGVALMKIRPRSGQVLALTGILLLALLSMPMVASVLIGLLAPSTGSDWSQASRAQAIVIIGGGTREYAPEFGGSTMNSLTLERIRFGARIAKATGLPVLVSGGTHWPGPTEAMLMQDALTHEYGVPVRWAEPLSQSTHENAVESARILKNNGIVNVILVAHSFDVRRAGAEFAAQGLSVTLAPTGIPSPSPFQPLDFWPSPAGLQDSYYALYELLALTLFKVGH